MTVSNSQLSLKELDRNGITFYHLHHLNSVQTTQGFFINYIPPFLHLLITFLVIN